jgi:type II secretory pathway component PulF
MFDDLLSELLKQLGVVLLFMLTFGIYLVPFFFLYGVYRLVSLPLRRRERARLFLDVLELGIEDGQTPERAVMAAAQSNDPILGKRFASLASHLESGTSLKDALGRTPRFLPPQVSAMLTVGAELGDVRRVLPACRQTLRDALSQTRGALNYLAILTFIILPVLPVVSIMLSVFVLPKFEQIADDMGAGIPLFSQAVFGLRYGFVWAQIAVMSCFQLIMFCYIAGPRMRGGSSGFSFFIDRMLWLLPWRQKRIQRDFATMLALLLDAGVPEHRALLLAAESSNNSLFIRRAQAAAERISVGTKLTEAVRALDDSGEFQWRLANAAQGQGGFLTALRGWFEALDAKAFQQEQAAAQTLTTALVLWNGLMIGAFVVGMFNVLTNIVEEASLW